jgi:DNA polymerase-3 subunit epsilon
MRVGGLDLETTGLDQAAGHRIVEVALVIYDQGSAKELGRYSTRINPQRGIDPKAEAVHKISFDSLIGKPLWEEVAPKLSKLVSACDLIVAHNGVGFDAPFLWGEFLRVGTAMPKVGIVDTMLQGRWATPDGAIPNLQALCFACGVPYDKDKAHGATYDVEVMMNCYFKFRDRGFFPIPFEPYQYTLPKEKKK